MIANAARELGISTLALSKRLGISQPTTSQSVKPGEKIVKEKGTQADGMTYANISIPVPSRPPGSRGGKRCRRLARSQGQSGDVKFRAKPPVTGRCPVKTGE